MSAVMSTCGTIPEVTENGLRALSVTEDGITQQIEKRIIEKRDAFDFGERPEDDDDA